MKNNNVNFVSIGDLWRLCVANWHWYIVAIVLCMAVAAFKVSKTVKTYTANAAIMVLDEKEGKSSRNVVGEEFSNMGIVSQPSNAHNVVKQMTSLHVLMEAAHRLDTTADEEQTLIQALTLRGRLSVDKADKNSTVINLTYKDSSIVKAKQVLVLVIQAYNDKWMEEKRLVTQTTTSFIESRLALLKSELDSLDQGISSFKSDNIITDVQRVGEVYLQQRSQSDAEIMRMTNQRSVARYVRNLLGDENAAYELLPVNSGIKDNSIESQIANYNEHVLQYNSHLDYTSEQNPRIIIQEKELKTLRSNIQKALDNYIKSLSIQIVSLENYNNRAVHNISSNPMQAKYLATIEREQKVKEGLYLYLLQKKEENEISSSYQRINIKTIDSPYISSSSSSKKATTFGAAFLLGLLLPTLVVFVGAVTDKTVRSRTDLEAYPNLMMIGEVPEYGKKKGFARWIVLARRLGAVRKIGSVRKVGLVRYLKSFKTILTTNAGLVVEDGKQDSVNEAFRLMRTKVLQNDDCKVYMFTSFEDGAGKSFVSANLALALAVNHRRVLFIDGDLRSGMASRLFGAMGPGLSDYLCGSEKELSYMLFQLSEYPTLDILPSGALPSNPTELLSNEQFGDLIDSQKSNYDFILVDCPETGSLADAEIIADHTDTTVFVVRKGKTIRDKVDELDATQKRGKYAHLDLVLNGV